MHESPKYLTVSEASRLYRRCKRIIRELVAAGLLEHCHQGNKILIDAQSAEMYFSHETARHMMTHQQYLAKKRRFANVTFVR